MRPQEQQRFLRPLCFLLISILVLLCMAGISKSSWTNWRKSNRENNSAGIDPAAGKGEWSAGKGEDGLSMIALPGAGIVVGKQRMAFAHFMLGNTYPYTRSDWVSSLLLASQTGLDALALNLGPEPWQTEQLLAAYTILSSSSTGSTPTTDSQGVDVLPPGLKLKLFLSLDMTVLPSSSEEDMNTLVNLVVKCGKMDAQLIIPDGMQSKITGADPLISIPLKHNNARSKQPAVPAKPLNLASHYLARDSSLKPARSSDTGDRSQPTIVDKGKIMLSTFGGEGASFGGKGWEGLKAACSAQGVEIFFAPAFFLPPARILSDSSLAVDAPFNWNSGWPAGDHPITEVGNSGETEFLNGDKPYMAAISPWFFTHYGTTGPYPYDKNWIYRSDDNLFANRWNQILELDPQFVEIVSWSDFGESHYIGPVVGAQPGSQDWTDGMDHEAWRLMTADFIRMFKGVGPVSGDLNVVKFYLSYRTTSKDLAAWDDPVAIPRDANWARDVIAIYALAPLSGTTAQGLTLNINTGSKQHQLPLAWDSRGQFIATVDFAPGPVSFTVTTLLGAVLLEGQGRPIEVDSKIYNFNAWTGHWSLRL